MTTKCVCCGKRFDVDKVESEFCSEECEDKFCETMWMVEHSEASLKQVEDFLDGK